MSINALLGTGLSALFRQSGGAAHDRPNISNVNTRTMCAASSASRRRPPAASWRRRSGRGDARGRSVPPQRRAAQRLVRRGRERRRRPLPSTSCRRRWAARKAAIRPHGLAAVTERLAQLATDPASAAMRRLRAEAEKLRAGRRRSRQPRAGTARPDRWRDRHHHRPRQHADGLRIAELNVPIQHDDAGRQQLVRAARRARRRLRELAGLIEVRSTRTPPAG